VALDGLEQTTSTLRIMLTPLFY